MIWNRCGAGDVCKCVVLCTVSVVTWAKFRLGLFAANWWTGAEPQLASASTVVQLSPLSANQIWIIFPCNAGKAGKMRKLVLLAVRQVPEEIPHKPVGTLYDKQEMINPCCYCGDTS